MSAKHTPGPWRVGGDGFMATGFDRKRIGGNTPISVVSDGGSGDWAITAYVAYVAAGTTDKRIADAHLLAAAPDLLEACKELLSIVEAACEKVNVQDARRVVHAVAAIAKAEPAP